MVGIVELREMGNDKLREMLEDLQEERFNLRFQRVSGQLEDYNRLTVVKRQIARLRTVLHTRVLAQETAAGQQDVAAVLSGKAWDADVNYNYEEGAWVVQFKNEDGGELASAKVDLNKRDRTVLNYEIAG